MRSRVGAAYKRGTRAPADGVRKRRPLLEQRGGHRTEVALQPRRALREVPRLEDGEVVALQPRRPHLCHVHRRSQGARGGRGMSRGRDILDCRGPGLHPRRLNLPELARHLASYRVCARRLLHGCLLCRKLVQEVIDVGRAAGI
eukprot:scaffold46654_cov64-Phaeocystis_antarctica.AAC.2